MAFTAPAVLACEFRLRCCSSRTSTCSGAIGDTSVVAKQQRPVHSDPAAGRGNSAYCDCTEWGLARMMVAPIGMRLIVNADLVARGPCDCVCGLLPYSIEDLLSVHGDMSWCGDSNANLVTLHANDCHDRSVPIMTDCPTRRVNTLVRRTDGLARLNRPSQFQGSDDADDLLLPPLQAHIPTLERTQVDSRYTREYPHGDTS